MYVGFEFLLHLLCLAVTIGTQTSGLFDYSQGKKVTLNPRLLEWREAVLECEERNGTLLTITDIATMYDLGIDGRWIVWVGLKTNTTSGTWHSRLPVTYANWDRSERDTLTNNTDEYCIAVETSAPFWWTTLNCSTKLPSLCETYTGDACEFTFYRRSSLIGFSTTYFTNIDLELCRNSCITTTSFKCQSFEYNKERRLCQLSDTNRWAHQSKFATNDREWDYYHLDCYSSDVNQSLIANGWEPTTMPTTQVTEKICYTVQELLPTENETREMETAIQELQEMGTTFKERRRSMTKASATDDRPSATYLGTIAIVMVSVPLGLIVALDVLTMSPQCCKKKKKKTIKVSQAVGDSEALAVLAQRRLILSSELEMSSGTSGITSTDTSNRSSPIEIEDVRIQIRRPVLQATATMSTHVGGSNSATLPINRIPIDEESGTIVKEPVCLNTEIEITDTVHATLSTQERDEYSCINAAYVNTSPVLSPFYRSHSEKTAHSGIRRGHINNTSTEQKRRQRKNSSEQGFVAPKYSTFGSADFTLWPYNSVDKYYKRNTKYGHEKFILAYGSSSAFKSDEEVESFRC